MNAKRIGALMISAAMLSGCANFGAMTATEVATLTDLRLCDAFSRDKPAPALRAEIKRRDLFGSDAGRYVIDAKTAYWVGMSELQFICANGYPGIYGDVSMFADYRGTTTQYYYRYGVLGFHATYVYAAQGTVYAIDKVN